MLCILTRDEISNILAGYSFTFFQINTNQKDCALSRDANPRRRTMSSAWIGNGEGSLSWVWRQSTLHTDTHAHTHTHTYTMTNLSQYRRRLQYFTLAPSLKTLPALPTSWSRAG